MSAEEYQVLTNPAIVGKGDRLPSGHSVNRRKGVFAFDIEGSGAIRTKNQLLAFGWASGNYHGQVVLYLGRRECESWEDFWKRSGFDMDCFNDFWNKKLPKPEEGWNTNLEKFEALQIPPHICENSCQLPADGPGKPPKKYWRFTHTNSFLHAVRETNNGPEPGDVVVIEAESYSAHMENQDIWEFQRACSPRIKISPILYIRAYTERDLAFIIHEVLKEYQKNKKLTFVSDTLHYDASWVDMLLEKYGHPPLMYDQSGEMGYKFICWGRELGSYQMGLCAAGNDDSSKAQYTKTKRWIEAKIENGWNPKNAHFASDDALKIEGSWFVAEEANRRRYDIHERLASCLREPVPDEETTEEEKDMTPEERAEHRDERPNWVVVDEWMEQNIDQICELASSSSKRQRTN